MNHWHANNSHFAQKPFSIMNLVHVQERLKLNIQRKNERVLIVNKLTKSVGNLTMKIKVHSYYQPFPIEWKTKRGSACGKKDLHFERGNLAFRKERRLVRM